MWVVSAGVAAFVVVFLGALGAYMLMGVATNSRAVAAQRAVDTQPPAQLPAPPQDNSTGGSGNENGLSVAVSADQAASIAQASVPGSSLMSQPRLVNFGGTVAYEVALNSGYVYVDANSGQVLFNASGGRNGLGRRRPRGTTR